MINRAADPSNTPSGASCRAMTWRRRVSPRTNRHPGENLGAGALAGVVEHLRGQADATPNPDEASLAASIVALPVPQPTSST